MKKAGFGHAACPIARSVSSIGDFWSLLIIRDAICGVRRFGEFQKNLGLAKNILAARLKKLVGCGILELAPASDGSAYQEYVPTQRGLDLLTVIVALGQWGDKYLVEADETCVMLQEIATGRPVAELAIRSQDGRSLTLDELGPPTGAYAHVIKAQRPKVQKAARPVKADPTETRHTGAVGPH